MFPIDLVITYCNSNNQKWRRSYNYFKKYEIEKGLADKDDLQSFGECRTRDWGFIKHWFRAVETNIPWIRKVFIIVQHKDHVPKWLNENNPKVRIVEHREFIPKNYLPTFNALTIQLFLSRIKDLSEHFIYSDDDFFFMNPIKPDLFFTEEGVPCHDYKYYGQGYYKIDDISGTYMRTLNNCMDVEEKYFNIDAKRRWLKYHLPVATIKSFESQILETIEEEIKERHGKSRFRNKTNINHEIYYELMREYEKCEDNSPYGNSKVISLRDKPIDFHQYDSYTMLCFNDNELASFSLRPSLLKYLNERFPNISSFEKETKKNTIVEATDKYIKAKTFDAELRTFPEKGVQWLTTKERANMLKDNGFVIIPNEEEE